MALELATLSQEEPTPVIECELLRSSGSFEISYMSDLTRDFLLVFADAARAAGLPIHKHYHLSPDYLRAEMLRRALLEAGAKPYLYSEERMDSMTSFYQWYAAAALPPQGKDTSSRSTTYFYQWYNHG